LSTQDRFRCPAERVDARDVVLVGNSFGGWIAAEMALAQFAARPGSFFCAQPGSIPVRPADREPGDAAPADRAAFAFHNPNQFAAVPATEEGLAMMAANQKAMLSYSGETFDSAGAFGASMVIWGESDRIVDVEYGGGATQIPGARFEVVAKAGQFPHTEKL
jgi:pimeloyl-ACP methyl ester carboxylesterase